MKQKQSYQTNTIHNNKSKTTSYKITTNGNANMYEKGNEKENKNAK